MKTNAQKKQDIEAIWSTFMTNLSVVQRKRDSIVANFIAAIKEKRLDEIRKSLQ